MPDRFFLLPTRPSRLLSLVVLLLIALAGGYGTAQAQSYEAVTARYPNARAAVITADVAFVYAQPTLSSRVVGRYSRGRALLAYDQTGDFYAVATPAQGHVGYVLLTVLNVPQVPGATVAPAHAFLDEKDPRTATLMSLLAPGAGHMYVGDMVTGAALFAVGTGAVVVGFALSDQSREVQCPDDPFDCALQRDYAPLFIGLGIYAATWVTGIATAAPAARKHNAAQRLRLHGALAPAPGGMRLTLHATF